MPEPPGFIRLRFVHGAMHADGEEETRLFAIAAISMIFDATFETPNGRLGMIDLGRDRFYLAEGERERLLERLNGRP